MKRVLFTSLLLLLLLSSSLSLSGVIRAGGEGPSASGNFQISLEDGKSRDIIFNARLASDGSTTGEITFRDGLSASEPKAAADNASEAAPPFYAKAVCDCLVVEGIQAVMGGIITEASLKEYVGRRVLLVVQDGDSITPPLRDRLTFGFYRTTAKRWVATDGERPEEQIQQGGWVAKDAERSDDSGTISQTSEEVTCKTFPSSLHSFIAAKLGKGKIQVSQ